MYILIFALLKPKNKQKYEFRIVANDMLLETRPILVVPL